MARVKEYKFRSGSRLDPKLANEAGKRLAKLNQANKQLTADVILRDARTVMSPLHSFFEWDDTAAAEKYRLEQARHLIRSVVVYYSDVPQPKLPARAFVSVQAEEPNESRYVPVHQALSDVDLRKEVLSIALQEAESWQARHANLDELKDIFDQIEATKNRLNKNQ